jgi:hypothetical protein
MFCSYEWENLLKQIYSYTHLPSLFVTKKIEKHKKKKPNARFLRLPPSHFTAASSITVVPSSTMTLTRFFIEVTYHKR